VNGAAGRMGRLLVAGIVRHASLDLAAALDLGSHPDQGTDAGVLAGVWPAQTPLSVLSHVALRDTEVVIDFSLPAGTEAVLDAVDRQALVVGVTGLDDRILERLREHSERAPVVLANNFSTGINVLIGLVEQAAAILEDYDLEVVEMHHSRKRDAPSGTARSLAAAGARGRHLDLEGRAVHGRQGPCGPRTLGEIGLHAVRGGDLPGEHTVYLAGVGERLALSHLATSREAFVDGAMRAACWVGAQPPGLYTMRQVLGFKLDPITPASGT